jgi:hypothetical protein
VVSRSRSALAAAALTAVAMLFLGPSCGATPRPCGPDWCAGCCDEGGECHAGTGLLECGGGGEACFACSPHQVCKDALCQIWVGGEYDGGFMPDPDSGQPRTDGGNFFVDGGLDAGGDAGLDAGFDGGVDAGFDAGAPDAGDDGGEPDAGDPDAGDGG